MSDNIALTFNDLFSVPAQVLTYSIIKNNPDSDLKFFYVINPDFDEEKKKSLETNLNLFKNNFPKFDFQILPVPKKIDDYLIEEYSNYPFSRFSIYRCYLNQILPNDVDSVLYLDCDMICDGKLDLLFDYYEQYQIQNPKNQKIIFACSNIPPQFIPYSGIQKSLEKYGLDDYFNSGTLLINLKNWRSNQKFKNKLLEEIGKNHQGVDQDSLNIACHNDLYQNISLIYDYLFAYDVLAPEPHPIIYHFTSGYPLQKRNKALWKKIVLKLKLDFVFNYLKHFYSNVLLRKNNFDSKLFMLLSSPRLLHKAKKLFFKYYDPYLELVK